MTRTSLSWSLSAESVVLAAPGPASGLVSSLSLSSGFDSDLVSDFPSDLAWVLSLDCALSFLRCLAKSSADVSLVKAIILPSGDHTGPPAPRGRSVIFHDSPPPLTGSR